MAFRLMSHHRMKFRPSYSSGSSSILTNIARRMLTIEVTSPQEFEEQAIKSSVPVIVDFHAGWCGPCKTLNPILKSIMENYEGKVNLVKVDVDELQDLAMDYGVMSIPYLIGLKEGEIVGTMVGLKSKEEIQDFVEVVSGSV